MPRGIYNRLESKPRTPHTEETRRKISEKNKGRIRSEETRKKLSLSHKGKINGPCSEEKKRKISEKNKGKHTSPRTEFKKGHKLLGSGIAAIIKRDDYVFRGHVFEKGKHYAIDTEFKKGHNSGIRFEKGHIPWMTGKKHTEETRKILREKRLRQTLPKKDTVPEKILQNILVSKDISFEKHKKIFGQPDIFIQPNICIFVDGCYWHACPKCFPESTKLERIIRDIEVTRTLTNQGYKVIRLWEHEIRNFK